MKPGFFATFAIGIACAAALAFIRAMFNLFKEDLETHSDRVKVRGRYLEATSWSF